MDASVVRLSAIFSLCIYCIGVAAQPPTKITIYGDDAYPPYSYLDDGQASGVYTEILQKVFNEMPEYQVTIKLVPWKRGLKLLESGDGFALFPPYSYVSDRPYISPYSIPILDEEVVVYCQPDSLENRQQSNWPSDYYGLTFGINDAFSLGGEEFWRAVKQGDILLREAKSNRINILSLYKNRIDCYINDRLSILWEVNLLIDEGLVAPDWNLTFGTFVSTEQGYLGFSNSANDRYPYKDDFVEKFNFTLQRLKQEGSFEHIISHFMQSN